MIRRKITLTMQPDPEDGNAFTVVAKDEESGITGGAQIDMARAVARGTDMRHMIFVVTRSAVGELLDKLVTVGKITLR